MSRHQTFLFYGTLLFILFVGGLVVSINRTYNPIPKDNQVIIQDKAVAEGKALFRKAVLEGRDLLTGPCLSNDLMKDWVVDIVHDPRESMDDLPANQCQAYLEGRAKHFVELDTSGNLYRVR
jgi:hypothetical protein